MSGGDSASGQSPGVVASFGGATAPPLRVTLVGPSLDILGGQAVQLARLLEQLRHVPELQVDFLPVNPRLPAPIRFLQRIKYVRTVVTSAWYIASLLVRLRSTDVVHAFSASYWSFLLAPVPAMIVGRLFGKGVLLNYHSGEAEDHLARWRSAMVGVRMSHRIVVPSEYLRDVFARFGLDAAPIPNFIEPGQFPFRLRRSLRPVFLSNRNLEPLYNVACSVRAFARIQRELPQARLIVAGFGSERPHLERLVGELGLSNVEFRGRVAPHAMGALLNEADVLLNSPDIDNMPLSLIEAQAAGLPIVSTRSGGIPYLVRDGATGLLVDAGDDAALAAAALRLFREPGLAERLASAAREECLRRYVWSAVRSEWVNTYHAVATRGATVAQAVPVGGEAP